MAAASSRRDIPPPAGGHSSHPLCERCFPPVDSPREVPPPHDDLRDRLHRPAGVRDRDSAPPPLCRAVPSLGARVRAPAFVVLRDAVPVRSRPRPPLRPVRAKAGAARLPRGLGRGVRAVRFRRLPRRAVRRANHRRDLGRQHLDGAGIRRRRDEAGRPREGDGGRRSRVRPGIHLRPGDRGRDGPVGPGGARSRGRGHVGLRAARDRVLSRRAGSTRVRRGRAGAACSRPSGTAGFSSSSSSFSS